VRRCEFIYRNEVWVCRVCKVPAPYFRGDNPERLFRQCPASPLSYERNGVRARPLATGGAKDATTGPGTELKALLAKWGIVETGGCNCRAMARKMDTWGVDGCEEHMDEILDHMEAEATKRRLPIPFRRSLTKLLVNRAIRNARKKRTRPVIDALRKESADEYITTAQLMEDTYAMVPHLPTGIDAVAGSARSGMLPATALACRLHVGLWAVDGQHVTPTGHGWRLQGQDVGPTKILLVEDTVFHGRTIGRCKEAVRKAFPDAQIITAAVYCRPESLEQIDIAAVSLPGQHFLEWNLFNSAAAGRSAYDFDGIFCEDIAREDDDDGPRYLEAIRNAKPKHYVRRVPIPMVLTARLEKYRDETVAWLAGHGMSVAKLVMFPGTFAERSQPGAVAQFKAGHYQRSPLRLYIESSPQQATQIVTLSRKPVLCPAAGKVFRP